MLASAALVFFGVLSGTDPKTCLVFRLYRQGTT